MCTHTEPPLQSFARPGWVVVTRGTASIALRPDELRALAAHARELAGLAEALQRSEQPVENPAQALPALENS